MGRTQLSNRLHASGEEHIPISQGLSIKRWSSRWFEGTRELTRRLLVYSNETPLRMSRRKGRPRQLVIAFRLHGMPRHTKENNTLSRRTLLKGLGVAPLLLRSSPLQGYSLLFRPAGVLDDPDSRFHFSDIRLTPHYPAKSPLEDVLRLVP